MGKKIQCAILKDGKFIEKRMEDTLENYYKEIGCRCIDIATRQIGDCIYDIVLDDEGLLKDKKSAGVIDFVHSKDKIGMTGIREVLAGNLIFLKHLEGKDHSGSLGEVELTNLKNSLMYPVQDAYILSNFGRIDVKKGELVIIRDIKSFKEIVGKENFDETNIQKNIVDENDNDVEDFNNIENTEVN